MYVDNGAGDIPELYSVQYFDQEEEEWYDVFIADINGFFTVDYSLAEAVWRDYKTRHPCVNPRIVKYIPEILGSKNIDF